MTAMTYELRCFGIVVVTDGQGSGAITSDLTTSDDTDDYSFAIDGLESLILAHACAGVDIMSPGYIEGIETAVEAITNSL